jgi:hypothetical protein
MNILPAGKKEIAGQPAQEAVLAPETVPISDPAA